MDTSHGGNNIVILAIMWSLQIMVEVFHWLGGMLQYHIPPLVMDLFQISSWTVVITVTLASFLKKRRRPE